MAEPDVDGVGQVVDGRYVVEAVIGRGGMGTVFRARHVFTHAQVALKVISDGLDADTVQRFLAEARVAAAIDHPGIVEVSDANRTPDGQLYIVMELLAGRSLRSALAGLSGDEAKRIGLELLDALQAAHTRGIVHRDLKPDNIFLVAPGNAVKILDFGIAKILGENSSTSRILGTPEYMAPEQLWDPKRVDGRADLWAVGVMLYEMIAGVRPFPPSPVGDRLAALHAQRPIPIEDVVPVSAEVSAFFATALAIEPTKRFETAAAMAAALRWLVLAPQTAQDPNMTVGTGSMWIAPPTLGTGDAWAKPVSQPPIDEPRARAISAPPGPTLGTGDAWVKPGSIPPPDEPIVRRAVPPGSIPPPDAYLSTALQPQVDSNPSTKRMPRDEPRTFEPAAPRRRWGAILAIGAVAVGGAIAIGVLARGPSSTDKVVTVPSDARPDSECQRSCEKLASCGLAHAKCQNDCERGMVLTPCVSNALNCNQVASCLWKWTCGRVPEGGLTCREALECQKGCPSISSECVCHCMNRLSPKAELLMGRLFVCRVNIGDDLDAFATKCFGFRDECVDDRP